MRKEIRERVPIAYLPIPGRSNPVVVASTYNSLIIDVRNADRQLITGTVSDEVESMMAAFLKKLNDEVGELPPLEITVFTSSPVIEAFTYVAITNAVLEYLGGTFDEDIIKAAQRIDRFIGADHSILALREDPLRSPLYIWREGEGAVESDREIFIDVSKYKVLKMNYSRFPYLDIVTHLAGVATIDIFRRFCEGEVPEELRVLNALWHVLYDIPLRRWERSPYSIVKDLSGATPLIIREVRP